MNSQDFVKFLNDISLEPLRVLDASIPNSKYIPLDLSESNQTLNTVDVSSSSKLGGFVNNHISKQNAQVAYGGYLEVRNIYKRSNHFNRQAQDERNIHLGIDLWCDAEYHIYTPLEGTVHSFKNNTNYGDYGPTIILKHTISGVEFYTLYGHLSLASIQDIVIGQEFTQNEKIATLGDAKVNGDYPPHLHFQIIKDIEDFKGDYPGVCSNKNLNFYKANCPNPNLLLKLKI
ncbi:peptidoglycan DD-metalloendopeptidase family protein [uncultured Algibacter sp.]|uniref:peptidoglycan DD-metalloendopeptidase family protein n=1 Tax=uncultured Algibacter sp. TaxID=298659 RepID=UPI00260792A6|nr:peptidoglycan DD-metalloendopeptidase family protein [uncultured Algibacter sp.]